MNVSDRDELILDVSRQLDKLRDRMGEPDWVPLQMALEPAQCAGFMWMGVLGRHSAADPIHGYKHGITRLYLNLSYGATFGLRAWRYVGEGRYIREGIDTAIEHAFEGLPSMGATRTTAYDDEYITARNRALRDAGWDVIS